MPVQPAAVSSVGVDPVAAGGVDPGALDAELPEKQVGLGRGNVPPCLAGLVPDLDGVPAVGSVPGSPRVFADPVVAPGADPDAPEAERPDEHLVLHGGEDGEAPAVAPFAPVGRFAANANGSDTSSVTTDDSFDDVLEADPRTREGIRVIFAWSDTSRWVCRLPPHFSAPV